MRNSTFFFDIGGVSLLIIIRPSVPRILEVLSPEDVTIFLKFKKITIVIPVGAAICFIIHT